MADEGTNGLTNFQKWRIFTDGLTSPDDFIDYGFYSLIAASLQRRVWMPPSHKPLFFNLYGVLVGPPGVGKGLVTSVVMEFLKHFKKSNPYDEKAKPTTGKDDALSVDRDMEQAAAYADFIRAQKDADFGGADSPRNTDSDGQTFYASKYKKSGNTEPPLLIPVAADSTTYEALVTAIARSLRSKLYAEYSPGLGKNVQKVYIHSSIAFCLEEMSSLFKKKAEDVTRFLLITYDCKDYKKETKTQGVDNIKKCCVNLIAGATPEFMRRLFREGLADEGFASRTIFIVAQKDRKTRAFIPELTPHQKQCQLELLEHVKKLTELYGQVTFSPEAVEYIEQWHIKAQANRPNIHEKLQDYYSRKKVHLMKISGAIHFGESTSMEIGLDEVIAAQNFLDRVERLMHLALVTEAKNPYFRLGQKICEFLEEVGPKTLNALRAKFWEDLPNNNPYEALEMTLQHLVGTNKVATYTEGTSVMYSIMRQDGTSKAELEP